MSAETMALRNKAADLLEECGWVQRTYGSCNRGFCADGALMHAARPLMTPDGDFPNAYWEAYNALADEAGYTGRGGIIAYNDVDGRTKDEVIDLLRGKAA